MLENVTSLFGMCSKVRGDNKEIVHIDNEPSFSDHVVEQVIHEPLECGGEVTNTEEHDDGFEKSFVDDESHFPLIAIFDANIVIPPVDIKLSEVISVFQLVNKVRDEREGVGVFGGMFIEVMIILTGMEFAILLLDEKERRCLGGV